MCVILLSLCMIIIGNVVPIAIVQQEEIICVVSTKLNAIYTRKINFKKTENKGCESEIKNPTIYRL